MDCELKIGANSPEIHPERKNNWHAKPNSIEAAKIKIKPLLLDGNYIFKKIPCLSWKELLFGLEHGYIDEKGITTYVCDALTINAPKEAFELASIEPQEYYLVRDLLRSLACRDSRTEPDITKPWLFLLLSYLFENKETFEDPLSLIEELYSDFDYPEEIAPLVRYMPVAEGIVGSEELLIDNWKAALLNYKFTLEQQGRIFNEAQQIN